MAVIMTVRVAFVLVLLLDSRANALAQGVDLTVFVGRAFPTYDERLTLRPSSPSVSGVDIAVDGSPAIDASGGPVFGGALAFEWGVLGIEGRLDATEVKLDLTGARYTLRGTAPPFQGLAARITVSDGTFDVDRIGLLSANLRVRTPGPIGLVASGGLSYLPDIKVTGSTPLQVEVAGLPLPGLSPTIALRAAPGQSNNRWGVNGGAGIRLGGRVALVGEVRVFYFRDYELRFDAESTGAILDELVGELAPVRFDPVFVNAQAGLTFRF